MKNTKIEVEGGEILIQSKEGHYAVIPAKHRREVMDMVKDNCDDCINSYIQGLPKEADYAEDGTLISGDDKNKFSYKQEPYIATQDNTRTVYPQQNKIKYDAMMYANQKEADYQKAVKTSDETEFKVKYNTSPHRYKYDTDPKYKAKTDDAAAKSSKINGSIDYPNTDSRSKAYVGNPNLAFMNPNRLTGKAAAENEQFHMNVIGSMLPIPGINQVGKVKGLENIVAKGIGALSKADKVVDASKAGSKLVSSVDDVVKQPWQMEELPGLHLQSTMEGEAISKIVEPKTGKINTEQALAIIAKESGGADKVALIKQGLGENIPKKIDYNNFRKVVQDQLIPLERQFSTGRSAYGINELGYTPLNQGATRFERFQNFMNTPITELFKKPKLLENQTLILGNKGKFGSGSSAHGNPEETLGHAHFLRDAETPDVLTVTQIQSDAFQGTHRRMPKGKLTKTNDSIDNDYIDEAGRYFDTATGENFTQKQLLDKTHQERYLQELVDYAGKRGDINKIRVPTSETAAKVQGYIPISELNKSEDFIKYRTDITNAGEKYGYNSSEFKKAEEVYNNALKNSKQGFSSEHQTILKKYSEQPKLIKKLFKQDAKTITDNKGNTWYEFNIPEKFKKGKGEIKAFSTTGAVIGTGAALQNNKTK